MYVCICIYVIYVISGDFNFERYAQQDTFVLSNIVPHHKYFHRYSGGKFFLAVGFSMFMD